MNDIFQNGDIVYEVPESKIVCCRGTECSRFGLVSVGKKKVSCLTCSAYSCTHTAVVKRIVISGTESPYHDLIDSLLNDSLETNDGTKLYKQKLISFKKIPFERSEFLLEGLKAMEHTYDFLLPDLENCRDCGHFLKEGDPVLENWIAYDHAAVITNNSVRYVKGTPFIVNLCHQLSSLGVHPCIFFQ